MIKLFDLAKETKAYGKFEMGRVYSNPYHTAFTPQVNEAEESEDHEVSMANNSIDTIIKMATELKAKMGENEKNIPAWIQDHISKAENYISQAASNYHEYGNENVNEGSLYSSQKLTIPQLGQLKIGDKVKYLGKDINGFMSGEEYEVSRRESSSTFQPTITIKNNRGKKLRTTNLSKINESVNENKKANILGIDFSISETDNGIFFAFADKKVGSIKVREIGSNKIANLIQNSLDKAYGKGSYFFKSGKNAEIIGGYLFTKNPTNTNLDKLKFEIVKEASPCWKGYKQVGMKDKNGKEVPNCVPNESVVNEVGVNKMYVKFLAVSKKVRELEDAQKVLAQKYFAEKDLNKKEALLTQLKKGTDALKSFRRNLSDIEEKYVMNLDADTDYDV
jgi:hypothetical protein